MTEKYSNREIDRMFGEIKDLLIEIREQTIKTNGRVTTLELWKENFMGKLIGASAVASAIFGVAFEFVSKHFTK